MNNSKILIGSWKYPSGETITAYLEAELSAVSFYRNNVLPLRRDRASIRFWQEVVLPDVTRALQQFKETLGPVPLMFHDYPEQPEVMNVLKRAATNRRMPTDDQPGMPWGLFRGVAIEDLPDWYLRLMRTACTSESNACYPEFRPALEAEYRRRFGSAEPPMEQLARDAATLNVVAGQRAVASALEFDDDSYRWADIGASFLRSVLTSEGG